MPRYYFYLLPKYKLIQFFHDRYFKGFLRICKWCAATVFLIFICLVLHDNATFSKENEKNALIRASIRRDSVAGAHYIDYIDMLYADKKAHQHDIDTLKRMYMK